MLNKRSLLKGGAGALIAGPQMGKEAAERTRGYGAPDLYTPDDYTRRQPINPTIDPFYEIKQAFLLQAEQQGDEMRVRVQAKLEALNDIKCLSNAYRRSRSRDLHQELETINTRLRQLRFAL